MDQTVSMECVCPSENLVSWKCASRSIFFSFLTLKYFFFKNLLWVVFLVEDNQQFEENLALCLFSCSLYHAKIIFESVDTLFEFWSIVSGVLAKGWRFTAHRCHRGSAASLYFINLVCLLVCLSVTSFLSQKCFWNFMLTLDQLKTWRNLRFTLFNVAVNILLHNSYILPKC